MFDRFILASNYDRITKRFNMSHLSAPDSYSPNFNIRHGQEAYVITNYQTKEIQKYSFGLTGLNRNQSAPVPFVRAEGDRNPKDDLNYNGSKAIFLKPEFRNLIRNHRCLVLADAFVVGIDKQPHLIYLGRRKRPFAFAGIWNKQKIESGETVFSFAIITIPANKLLQHLGYKRMPVILPTDGETRWLRPSAPLRDVLNLLRPNPYAEMNAFPISHNIADVSLNDKTLVKPVGKPVYEQHLVASVNRGDWRKKRVEGDKPTLGMIAARNKP